MTDRPRLLLGLAAVAVAFAAAGHLRRRPRPAGDDEQRRHPDRRAAAGRADRAGFLLGYVAMLPLIGRIADLRGGCRSWWRRWSCSPSARWSPRSPTTCPPWWAAGSSRASVAAAWCRHPRPGRRPLPGRPPRRPPGGRVRGPGARQRRRPPVRSRGAGRRRLARDLPGQPGGGVALAVAIRRLARDRDERRRRARRGSRTRSGWCCCSSHWWPAGWSSPARRP